MVDIKNLEVNVWHIIVFELLRFMIAINMLFIENRLMKHSYVINRLVVIYLNQQRI